MLDLFQAIRQLFPEAFKWLQRAYPLQTQEECFHVLKRSQKTLSMAAIRHTHAGEDTYSLLHEKRASSWKGTKLYLGLFVHQSN